MNDSSGSYEITSNTGEVVAASGLLILPPGSEVGEARNVTCIVHRWGSNVEERVMVARYLQIGLVVAGLISSSCVTDEPNQPIGASAEATIVASPETTESIATTSSSLSRSELNEIAEAEAGQVIAAVVEGYWLFPVDTSLGDDGLPLDFVTGSLEERTLLFASSRSDGGQVVRSRGGEAIDILSMSVNLINENARATVCARPDVIILNSKGEMVAEDVGNSIYAELDLVLVDGAWLIENFGPVAVEGETECVATG